MVPKPQPTPPRNDPRKFLQAYIFPRKILNINNIRKDGIEICTGLLTEEIRAWRDWEVLDEGVEGNLTMHLEEVLPSCKGKQGLTFKRHQGPVAILCHGGLPESGPINHPLMQTISIIAGPSYAAQPIPPMSEITKWFELEHQWQFFTWLFSLWRNFEIGIPKSLRLSYFCTKKL